jgi:RES domain-containing protein
MLYTSEHYSTAMLEKLAHASGLLPPNQHFITITIPSRTSCEVLDVAALPGWHHPACLASKAHGEAWYEARRSALLIVPSMVARHEHNFLINLDHPDARAITHSLHQPVWWDDRLFSATSP